MKGLHLPHGVLVVQIDTTIRDENIRVVLRRLAHQLHVLHSGQHAGDHLPGPENAKHFVDPGVGSAAMNVRIYNEVRLFRLNLRARFRAGQAGPSSASGGDDRESGASLQKCSPSQVSVSVLFHIWLLG
ncbi:MAG TPA: hypothetical protein PLP42_09200 [Acidobacteriota bacterium]|nr:hypothetical protein [Acidobacteriota bacterium]